MRYNISKKQVREASGERLLLMAIFGSESIKPVIRKEQVRRARARQRMELLQAERLSIPTTARAA